MSPEEVAHADGWTVETLLVSIDRRFYDLDRRLDERASSQQRALDAALLAADKAVNKVEEKTEKSIGEIKVMIYDLKESRAQGAGRSQGVSTASGLLLAIMGAACAVGGLLIAVAR